MKSEIRFEVNELGVLMKILIETFTYRQVYVWLIRSIYIYKYIYIFIYLFICIFMYIHAYDNHDICFLLC